MEVSGREEKQDKVNRRPVQRTEQREREREKKECKEKAEQGMLPVHSLETPSDPTMCQEANY